MGRKYEPKNPKYQQGDILNCINPINKNETVVILLSRWDRTPSQRVAWLCKKYPDGDLEFAVPESELFPIN